MSDLEERSDEVEVLMSIYAEEFAWVSEPTEFTVELGPPVEGEGSEVHVGVLLRVIYPSDYPSASIPVYTIDAIKGISKKQLEEMRELAVTTSEEGLGGPSVFSVCEALKEWLSDNNVAGQDDSMYAQMVRREQLKDLEATKKVKSAKVAKEADAEQGKHSQDPAELERIRQRQASGIVTQETFAKWKAAFDKEMLERAREDMAAGVELDPIQIAMLGLGARTRPSGKEIWLEKSGLDVEEDEMEGAVDEAGNFLGGMGGEEATMDADVEGEMYDKLMEEYAARRAARDAGGAEGDEDEDWSDGSSEYEEGDSEYESDDDYSDEDGSDDEEEDAAVLSVLKFAKASLQRNAAMQPKAGGGRGKGEGRGEGRAGRDEPRGRGKGEGRGGAGGRR